jgi:hypothetical protein
MQWEWRHGLRNDDVACHGSIDDHRIHVTEWGAVENPNVLILMYSHSACRIAIACCVQISLVVDCLTG